ncbi:MAG: hypothetical protein ACK56I_30490, partial [bacterium]
PAQHDDQRHRRQPHRHRAPSETVPRAGHEGRRHPPRGPMRRDHPGHHDDEGHHRHRHTGRQVGAERHRIMATQHGARLRGQHRQRRIGRGGRGRAVTP